MVCSSRILDDALGSSEALSCDGSDQWDCLENTRGAQHLEHNWPGWLLRYMLQHRDVPAPIIVLDNRDGHLSLVEGAPAHEDFPPSYLLIEGHNRFEIAAALFRKGAFAPTMRLWLMEAMKVKGPPSS